MKRIRKAAVLGSGVMGAGIAKEFAIRYSYLPLIFGTFVRNQGNKPCIITGCPNIMSFPTKNNWKDLSDIKLIEKSAEQIKNICDHFNFKSILSTRPGCGLGGLKWEDVKVVLENYFDDRFFIINKDK